MVSGAVRSFVAGRFYVCDWISKESFADEAVELAWGMADIMVWSTIEECFEVQGVSELTFNVSKIT